MGVCAIVRITEGETIAINLCEFVRFNARVLE